jgi:CBS domain-containing protein
MILNHSTNPNNQQGGHAMKVKDILKVKGTEVVTIDENSTLMAATNVFFSKKIGSLLVVDGKNAIKGILAPNDVLKAVGDGCVENCSLQKVYQVMTKNIICATESDDIDYIQAIMTKNRVRHIPIMDGEKLQGIVSIGDVVNAQINVRDVENRYLMDYIEGKYPG